MSLKFWKSKSSVKKFQTHNCLPLLVEDNENSFSFWKEELLYGKYKLAELNTFATSLSSYEAPFKDEFNINFSIKPDIKNIIVNSSEINTYIKQAILKDRILKNLYKILGNLHKECEEEDFQIFSEIARKNAKQILSFVYNEFPNYEYYIYPTEDREIAIDCNPQKGKGILVLCDSNGGIACFATFEGKNRRFRYNNIDDFSYRLLRETFEELDIEKNHSLISSSSRDSFFILKQELDHSFSKDKIYNYA